MPFAPSCLVWQPGHRRPAAARDWSPGVIAPVEEIAST